MKAENLNSSGYYQGFEYSGWDIDLMREILGSMELPDDIRHDLYEIPNAKFLVLGSATTRNIGNIAGVDRILRPGLGHRDHVTMIDYNAHPMQMHQREWDWLEPKVRGVGNEYTNLHYPDFDFVQGDIKQLPFADESFDIIVSDYTLNFLDTRPEIEQTFAEISRVLKPGGVMLFAVMGDEDIEQTMPVEYLMYVDPQIRQRHSGLISTQFPIQLYIHLAREQNLRLRAANYSLNDILCGVLKKTAHA